ncbi:MAG: outer membrane protein transport protein, partial [Acidobacteriota bacterium]|nr:outer membrane protein transport protein [Acidobacteriota bacterium]
VYAVVPLTNELNFGLGVFSQYGLGFRWDNPDTFSGRFISQNAVVQTADLNPVFSYQLLPELAIAVGADYRFGKVQLERNAAAINVFTQSVVDIAHVKLNSELLDNHGWGWNAGILYKPIPQFSLGASYRSKIKLDFEGKAKFTQVLTGNAVFDAAVAAQLPTGEPAFQAAIEFPATMNLGAAFNFPGNFTLSLEGDWTRWTSFKELNVHFPTLTGRDLNRQDNWKNSWAYRAGINKKMGAWAFRVGYYRDNTPQPIEDRGPVLADNDRDAYTAGVGFGTEKWSIDVSDLYLKVKDFDTTGRSNDRFYGRYKEAVNIFAFSLRLAF